MYKFPYSTSIRPLLTSPRIERYTGNTQSALSTSNLDTSTPGQYSVLATSPTISMRTNPSAFPPDFTSLPNPAMPTQAATFPGQMARMHPMSFSAGDIPSLLSTAATPTSPAKLPNRSSSLIFHPSSVPQPGAAGGSSSAASPDFRGAPQLQHRESVSHIDGFEPRIFPGVVSGRHRRSSVAARPSSASLSEPSDGVAASAAGGATADAVLFEEPEDSGQRGGKVET